MSTTTLSVDCRVRNMAEFAKKGAPNAQDDSLDGAIDARLERMPSHFFEGKDVVDIGCNEGVISLSLACKFAPKSMLGIDIDGALIGRARRNLELLTTANRRKVGPEVAMIRKFAQFEGAHPNLAAVQFAEEDFVTSERASPVDCVLFLSISKWIHLQWGDETLKQVFFRIHSMLRPGGIFVFEPQPWNSYKKKRKQFSEALQTNLKQIQFKPADFQAYLTDELHFELLSECDPDANVPGFVRPLLFLRKRE